ncbi:Phosphatidylinositol 4-phosphate 5-kinase-like protein 1 [Galemys pyrenaicus]|uniref:Phosphatidylinositol 4-phosphate 5-kinase-like protein 1 n=1 Tax=Galemys pyrenaicus TaxID=202257 RepID=A0A8J6A5R6_GALPY|nr:Phosphatidylinositol 4-phosphate 5-kinase-like protein 1 [Galemys pyrenaicus]
MLQPGRRDLQAIAGAPRADWVWPWPAPCDWWVRKQGWGLPPAARLPGAGGPGQSPGSFCGGDGRAEPGTPRGCLPCARCFCASCHQVLAPSPEARGRAATWSAGRCGLLWHLRDRQVRLGLFEIDPGHELHRLTCMMQAGLWAATQVSMDHPPTGLPTEEDFSEVLTQVHEGFELGTLAGPAFARLRRSLGLAEEDYQAALGPGGPYLQFLSTSKSKASFFLSHDQRFFLKTQRRREVRALLAHLPRYVQHLQRHPHSLLARLLGVHSLRVAGGKKVGEAEARGPGWWQLVAAARGRASVPPHSLPHPQKYFIVMQSVFYPAGRISERYDIKGCEVSRWVEPAPEGSHLLLVLKDLNFQGKTINLGPQRTWLLRQMELDTAFLQELNVLDYSLLVAFQHLHEDKRDRGRSLIFCTARSMQGVQSPQELETQNRRLLPDASNALHTLDGPEQRYFLGLVDLATVYGLRKRLEHLWKTLRYPGRTFSTVSPAHYARRLCQWVEAHTE